MRILAFEEILCVQCSGFFDSVTEFRKESFRGCGSVYLRCDVQIITLSVFSNEFNDFVIFDNRLDQSVSLWSDCVVDNFNGVARKSFHVMFLDWNVVIRSIVVISDDPCVFGNDFSVFAAKEVVSDDEILREVTYDHGGEVKVFVGRMLQEESEATGAFDWLGDACAAQNSYADSCESWLTIVEVIDENLICVSVNGSFCAACVKHAFELDGIIIFAWTFVFGQADW